MNRIIYTQLNGVVAVVVPSPHYKGTMEQLASKTVRDNLDEPEIVDSSQIPTDRVFRDAWQRGEQGKKVGIEMGKAKDITHGKRREKREEEMAPYDEIVSKQIPGQNPHQAEAARAQLRNKYAQIQDDIDATTTPDELKTIIDTELE